MAADPLARLADRQHALRSTLRTLQQTAPGSPGFPALLDETNKEVTAVLQARRDVESARLTVPNRAIAATTAVGALIVVIGWFDAWSLISLLIATAIAAAVLVDPTGKGWWEARARTTAAAAALLTIIMTPALSGWAAAMAVAGAAWWAWRTLR